MSAYYNEIDPHAAQWLRNLIAAGHIAPGDVDERSIEDVRPSDLRGYTQCHFFAGIGVWSYALRRAGFGDDRPVWTGSCPCQPFSSAGAGTGFDDERHLWPAFFHLISQCRPAIVFGEQVASKDAEPWIDLVQTDLEGVGYRVGAVPFPSAGVGAPHIRDRLYWMADADNARLEGRRGVRERTTELATRARGVVGRMADANSRQQQGIAVVRGLERDGKDARRPEGSGEPESRRDVRGMADSTGGGRREECSDAGRGDAGNRAEGFAARPVDGCGDNGAGPTNGFWRDADWLGCRDGKFRPVEPGTFPLVDGAPSRVVRLRAYGNAVNAEAAFEFIQAADEAMKESRHGR
ncbi:DNA cytosine methyltransferase [Caballeronia zhejiangensis]|uniref:DNA cytosine methyltransferase n=1 Tax=Caballeronia zhejiangensis TaxID=871203 RepID=UPI0007C740A4|nr:DNA cytosine methyltransferase [Caballeronia zhejiangensis]